MFILFAFLIGFFSAVMDRTNEEVAYNRSVFKNNNRRWWLRSVSWEFVKFLPLTKYRPDAWHLAQSCMYLCMGFCAGFTVHEIRKEYSALIIALIVATCITISKVIFYDYILKRNANN